MPEKESAPVYDPEEAANFIFERMTDPNRPYSERFPEEMIENGCLCKRLIETILRWDTEYMISKGFSPE